MSLVARAFDRWIEHQDENLVRAASSLRAWLTTSLFVGVVLPCLAYCPVGREYFALQLVPALLCYLPAVTLGFAFALWVRRGCPFSRVIWIGYLVDSMLVQFFCASLIVWCSDHGAAATCSLFLLTAAYQGHVLRVTPTEPFNAAGTVLAVLGAATLDGAGDKGQLLAFVGFAAVTVEFLVGSNAQRWTHARRATEQLRAALSANLLEARGREVKRLSDTLVDVLARNHDLNNAIMALRLNTDAIGIECEQRGDPELITIARHIRECVDRLAALTEEIRLAGRQEAPVAEAESVDVLATVDAVLPVVTARFPHVRCALAADRSMPLRAPIRGGQGTLRRVIENLLINACEGDGRRAAGQIRVEVFRDPSGGRVQMVVKDDGPGFQPAQLARDIEAFASTKPRGSGLGLHTCERLLAASGGQLLRENEPGSGARVTAILPLERA